MEVDDLAHPYNYITKDNFEKIQQVFRMSMSAQSTPSKMTQSLHEVTGLSLKICSALVQLEFLPTMAHLKKMEVNKNMPKGSKFKYG